MAAQIMAPRWCAGLALPQSQWTANRKLTSSTRSVDGSFFPRRHAQAEIESSFGHTILSQKARVRSATGLQEETSLIRKSVAASGV